MIRSAGVKYRAALEAEDPKKHPNKDLEANEKSLLLNGADAPSQLEDVRHEQTVSRMRLFMNFSPARIEVTLDVLMKILMFED